MQSLQRRIRLFAVTVTMAAAALMLRAPQASAAPGPDPCTDNDWNCVTIDADVACQQWYGPYYCGFVWGCWKELGADNEWYTNYSYECYDNGGYECTELPCEG